MQEHIIVTCECSTYLTMLQCTFGISSLPQQEFHTSSSLSIFWKPISVTLQIYSGFWIYSQMSIAEQVKICNLLTRMLPSRSGMQDFLGTSKTTVFAYHSAMAHVSDNTIQMQLVQFTDLGRDKMNTCPLPSFSLKEENIHFYQT